MTQHAETDLDALIHKVPRHIVSEISKIDDLTELLEIVLDIGRKPEVRFLDKYVILNQSEVVKEDIDYVLQQIGPFGEDNRAGIERTLHRISAIRNRNEKIIGLTMRVGRAVYGTIKIIEDLIFTGKSVLLLGKPGVGKTTMLREVARVLAEDAQKRVVVVDTSNEIAGDGDIPHPGIGRARRMHVKSPSQQHAVMIEAVENHMPEVIVIDEIGNEFDANAARTIAERGVQLVATAHGNSLENLVLNPTLSDLIGGIKSVTLGDVEARRRRSQKTVLERRSSPTFDIVVEIKGWYRVAVHSNVARVVDRSLRGFQVTPEIRTVDKENRLLIETGSELTAGQDAGETVERKSGPKKVIHNDYLHERQVRSAPATKILPYGVNRGKLLQAIEEESDFLEIVTEIESADLILTTKSFYRRKTQILKTAEDKGKPVYVLRKNTVVQIQQFLDAIKRSRNATETKDKVENAIKEAEEAASRVDRGDHIVQLSPQGAYIRRLQHRIAEQRGLSSSSSGRDPARHVVLHKK